MSICEKIFRWRSARATDRLSCEVVGDVLYAGVDISRPRARRHPSGRLIGKHL